jgi:putative tricarboxylic transport membrane protein
MALMVGAMTLKGIQPGPQVMDEPTRNVVLGPDRQSMWVGNLMLVVLNLPLIGICVIRLLTVPYRLLFPAIVVLLLHWRLFDQQQRASTC